MLAVHAARQRQPRVTTGYIASLAAGSASSACLPDAIPRCIAQFAQASVTAIGEIPSVARALIARSIRS